VGGRKLDGGRERVAGEKRRGLGSSKQTRRGEGDRPLSMVLLRSSMLVTDSLSSLLISCWKAAACSACLALLVLISFNRVVTEVSVVAVAISAIRAACKSSGINLTSA